MVFRSVAGKQRARLPDARASEERRGLDALLLGEGWEAEQVSYATEDGDLSIAKEISTSFLD